DQQDERGDHDPDDAAPRDPDGGEARLGRQPAERRFAVEEAARRDSPRHLEKPSIPLDRLTRCALGNALCFPPLPRSAGADCTWRLALTVTAHRFLSARRRSPPPDRR